MLLLALLNLALADDGDPVVGEISYEGGNSATAANYVKGKPVTITHASGNVSVRCMDTDKLSARLQYVVFGTQEGPMESMGKGIGLAVWGDANGGGAKTRVPSKPSGVSRAEVTLTVNVPMGTSAVTVSESGPGWVQVIDCDGNVKVTGGGGGVYVSGRLTGATVNASGGDVKVVQNEDSVYKNTVTVNAPAGNAILELAPAQGGKLMAKGSEVAVNQTVMGTTTDTLVQGDLGVAGPTINVSAKGKVEIKANR
jgi:hypothetical protein